MSEENKALTRRYFEEVFNERNLQAVDELYATDYVLHDPPFYSGRFLVGIAGEAEGDDVALIVHPDQRPGATNDPQTCRRPRHRSFQTS